MNLQDSEPHAKVLPIKSAGLQFSLQQLLLLTLALGIVLAIAVPFPRQSAFAVSMALLIAAPSAIGGAARTMLCRLGLVKISWPPAKSSGTSRDKIVRLFQSPARFLGLCQPEPSPRLFVALILAIVSTAIIVLPWAAIREFGLTAALVRAWPLESVRTYARQLPNELSSPEQWTRLAKWELWSVGRWWLLFGVITLAWLVASIPLARQSGLDRASQTVRRLLMFAPWIVSLEIAFLAGVWISNPIVVPEPSTGFVVGIFSWNLWHWDCWLDREWLVRGALPTFVAGTAFFRQVLRWLWVPALVAAICLIPVALTLSIAATVLYGDLFWH